MYKTHIELALQNAENNVSKITKEIIELDGMSGTKTRHFYNNLLNMEDARYLEIGTWKGSTVCSAMYQNNAIVVCIDNWSEFCETSLAKKYFLENFEKYKGKNNATYIENDCFNVDISLLPKFNIYMYDGNHSFESHYKALSYFYDCLDNTFIYVVDDWNTEEIRNATYKAIEDLKFIVLYQKSIRLTWDNTHTPVPLAKETWWNGMYVALLQKTNV